MLLFERFEIIMLRELPTTQEITNEVGINVLAKRLQKAIEAKQFEIPAGGIFLGVGRIERILPILKILLNAKLISKVVLVDTDPKVVDANTKYIRTNNMESIVEVSLSAIEDYDPANESVSVLDISNAFMWNGFNRSKFLGKYKNAALTIISDWVPNGKIITKVAQEEKSEELKRYAGGTLEDYFDDDPRTPSAQHKSQSLHILATTIPLNELI